MKKLLLLTLIASFTSLESQAQKICEKAADLIQLGNMTRGDYGNCKGGDILYVKEFYLPEQAFNHMQQLCALQTLKVFQFELKEVDDVNYYEYSKFIKF